MIKITNLTKIYKSKKRRSCRALDNINLTLPDSGLIFVLGKSGSGKSTLLNLIGGLDNITGGRIEVDGNDLSSFKEKDFCNYRNSHIGFIFQDYHLIDELTVYENIALSLNLIREKDAGLVRKALAKVELAGYEDRYPTELSGGERQRVAIARAIVKNPRIILADEPTGNLDTQTATSIVELLKSLAKDCLILIVSHNVRDAYSYADRIIELSKGRTILDISKNPNFDEKISLHNGSLIYPSGKQLEDQEINYINDNLARNQIRNILKRNDRYIPTKTVNAASGNIRIQKKSLSLGKELGISGKFLKNKTVAIALSSFMVAVIMVIMALAQTIIAFDAGDIIAKEMYKMDSNSIYMTKVLDAEQKATIGTLEAVSSCLPEVYESDIQKFKDTGYEGRIYEVLKYGVSIKNSAISAGLNNNFFTNSPYITESLGTMIVDEEFLNDKFGKIEYLAKAEEFHPSGIIITDYLADAIILSNNVTYAKNYQSLIGEYHWNQSSKSNCVSRGYINGVIYTGYKEKYSHLFEMINNKELKTLNDMIKNEDFSKLVNDIYGKLGFCYSLNPNFREDVLTKPSWDMVWHYSISFDGSDTKFASTGCQVRPGSFHGFNLDDYEIMINRNKYNEWFGTKYTSSNINTFEPHTVQLSHFMHYNHDTPLFTQEVKIVGIFNDGKNDMGGSFLVGDKLFDLFAKDYFYTIGLYFDGRENIDTVIDIAYDLGFEQNVAIIEGIHTMTKAVDVFIPIFRLIAIFLCVGVVFILVNFSTKMIKDKMHEIGILKAIGTSNKSIAVIFGLQILLIAVLTSVMTTIGYYYFIDLANDVLIESLKQLAKSHVVLDLQFLTFKVDIALTNCALVLLLAAASLLVPIIKIKNIKPVKIIKAKE